jgi:hypothetical protein
MLSLAAHQISAGPSAEADSGRLTTSSEPPRLLPILLPSWQTTTVTGRQAWNIGPEDAHPWTVLDDVPMPTDQKVGGSSPSERALQAHRLTGSAAAGVSAWRRLLDRRLGPGAVAIQPPAADAGQDYHGRADGDR